MSLIVPTSVEGVVVVAVESEPVISESTEELSGIEVDDDGTP